MNYNMNDTVQSEGKGLNFMDVGIHENCKLTEVRQDISPNGNKYIAFYFEDLEKRTLSFTEYEPKRRPNDTDESYASKIQNQMGRVRHIATRFMSGDEFKFDATNFDEFGSNVTRLLVKSKYQDVLVRLKVIYNWNNYTTLPPYLPFIEKMGIAKADSKLNISSIDKMVKETGDKESVPDLNPHAGATQNENIDTGTVTTDLPF